MNIELTKSDCAHRLMQDEYAGWSWEGAMALAEYYEELEADMGESISFDPVSIRCDWNEEALQDIKENYSYSFDGSGYTDFILWLQDKTCVIDLDNGNFLYMSFQSTIKGTQQVVFGGVSLIE